MPIMNTIIALMVRKMPILNTMIAFTVHKMPIMSTKMAIMVHMKPIFCTMIAIFAFMMAIFVSIITIMKNIMAVMKIIMTIMKIKMAIIFFIAAIMKIFAPIMKIITPIMKIKIAVTKIIAGYNNYIYCTKNTLTMRKLLTILAIFTTLAITTKAQPATNVQFINPETVSTPRSYSHAAIIDLGNCKMVIISGQVALDAKGTLVGGNDIAKQTEQVFRNIKSVVEAAGGKLDHLVKLGYFTTDVSRIQDVRNVRDQFITSKTKPASTLVQVTKLFREDVLIEIEATAVIPK